MNLSGGLTFVIGWVADFSTEQALGIVINIIHYQGAGMEIR